MRRRLLLIMPLLAFLGVVAFFYTALFSDPRELESALVGKKVPEFELPNLLDPARQISHLDLGEGPYLINVWATWCPTCKAEHAFLNELSEQGVKIIGINYKDEPTKARRWLSLLGDPYRLNILDAKGSLGIDLGVYGAPETYIVNSQGHIIHRHAGDVNQRNWQGKLAPLYYQGAGQCSDC